MPFVTPFTNSDLYLAQDVMHQMKDKFTADFQKDWDTVNQIPLAMTGPFDSY